MCCYRRICYSLNNGSPKHLIAYRMQFLQKQSKENKIKNENLRTLDLTKQVEEE